MSSPATRPDFEDATFGPSSSPAPFDPELVNARALHQRRLVVEHELAADFADARLAAAVRAALAAGRHEGERSGYIDGMHWGLLVGAIAATLVIALLAGATRVVWPFVSAWFS